MTRKFTIWTIVALLAGGAAQLQAGGLIYDASLGTLPQDQGFLGYDIGGSPAPTVSGGVLHQGLTSYIGQQFWYSNAQAGSFDNGFTMEAVLKFVSSTHGTPTRFGYYMDAGDSAGREFAIGFSSSGIAVNTDGTGRDTQGIPLTPFNTTGGFHDYKLVVSNGTGSLYIDNTLFATTPVDNSPFYFDPPNRVYFGDGSGNGNSETYLKSFRYEFGPATATPEPGGLTLLVLGLASIGGLAWLKK